MPLDGTEGSRPPAAGAGAFRAAAGRPGDGASPPGVLLIGFPAAESARIASVLAQAGHRAHVTRSAREAAALLDAVPIGVAIADLEGSFNAVLGGIEAVRAAGRPGCPLLGIGSIEAAAAMTDALRALGLTGLMPMGVSPQELIFRVNALLHPDRRQSDAGPSRRVPVDLEARFEGIDGPAEGRVLNLSGTGLFLAADTLLPTNRTVAVTFRPGPGAEPVTVTCRVVWANDGGDGQRYFRGMGLQFLQTKPAAREALRALVARRAVELGLGEAEARRPAKGSGPPGEGEGGAGGTDRVSGPSAPSPGRR